MKLSSFQIENTKSQIFLTTRHSNYSRKPILKSVLVDHVPSLVGTLEDSEHIIKFIRARSWHEYLKLLWNHSRITKEIKGSELLEQLGLTVPIIHEAGLGIIPSKKYEYIGYYIMENLTSNGYQELSKLIKEGALEDSMREKIMDAIFNGLKAMRDTRIVFSDFHLDNIFANDSGEITWIDPGVTTYKTINEKKFRKKFNHSINRYINYEYNGEVLLSEKESTKLSQLILPAV